MGQEVSSLEKNDDSSGSSDENSVPIFLTATQSCSIHGWTNPRRILSWKDISSRSISIDSCIRSGIAASDLHALQPSIQKWIECGSVSFKDVPSMLLWPLHPIRDLRGDISDLAQNRYPPPVLEKLGITYTYMRTDLLMDDDWMKMLRYKPSDWHKYLGFGKEHACEMGDQRTFKVFGMHILMLNLAMTSG